MKQQTVDMDIANRKRGYELRNNILKGMNTQISILLTIQITVNITCYLALIKKIHKMKQQTDKC